VTLSFDVCDVGRALNRNDPDQRSHFLPSCCCRLRRGDAADDMEVDGRPIDPTRLEADKTVCRGEMEQAELVTSARGLMPIYLPGQESPLIKVYNGCMARHGYAQPDNRPQ
jgi:hypothetical protein